jgi:transposase
MAREYHADYGQDYLLPPSVDEWISSDHPARFVRDVVEQLDLTALGFRKHRATTGAPSYSNDLLLKIWVYGYFEGIISLRKLEKACGEHIGLIWLTGQYYPDHNTLWRFYRDNKSVLKAVFERIVLVGKALGLVGHSLYALDGTRLKSAASTASGLHKEQLEKDLVELRARIERYTNAMEASALARETDDTNVLPEKLQNAQVRMQKIQESLAELESKGLAHFHPADPEATIVKTEFGLRFGYNAQALADEQSGMVVACDVFPDSDDKGLLSPMLQQTVKTLGSAAETTVADGGYNTDAEIAAAETMQCDVLISEHGQERKGPFSVDKFAYDEAQDCYVCPHGQPLYYIGEDKSRKDIRRIYRCRAYKNCPFRPACCGPQNGRRIKRNPFAQAVQAHNERRALPENRTKLKKRKGIIEHIFGWVKHTRHHRQWNVCGLNNVRGRWAMLCTAWNLKIIYKSWKVLKTLLQRSQLWQTPRLCAHLPRHPRRHAKPFSGAHGHQWLNTLNLSPRRSEF